MPGELLKIDLRGLPEVMSNYHDRLERLNNMEPVFELAHDVFVAEEAQQFKTEGAYLQGGQEWAPLSPAYAKRKPAPPAPFGILYRTGALYGGVTDESDPAHIKEIGPQRAVMGTSVSYGKYHQTGTPKMPQRKVISVRDRVKRLIFRAGRLHILRGLMPSREDV